MPIDATSIFTWKWEKTLLVTRSPSDGIPREIRLLEVVLDEAVGRVLYHFR